MSDDPIKDWLNNINDLLTQIIGRGYLQRDEYSKLGDLIGEITHFTFSRQNSNDTIELPLLDLHDANGNAYPVRTYKRSENKQPRDGDLFGLANQTIYEYNNICVWNIGGHPDKWRDPLPLSQWHNPSPEMAINKPLEAVASREEAAAVSP